MSTGLPNGLPKAPHIRLQSQLQTGSIARVCAVLVLALSLLVGANAWSAPLTNADVVKLVQSKLSADTIKLTINSAESTRFDTSSDGLIALSKAGVPEAVIQAMISRGSGAAPAAAPVAARPAATLKSNRRSVLPKAITPKAGGSYYTRHNLMYERGSHVTTNYWRGQLLPINSRVTLTSLKPKKMVLTLASGDTVAVAWAKKFSQRPLAEIASELLGDRAVPVDRLGKELAGAIKSGELRLGMSKEQVIMTRGYPPRHKTPSTDSNRWQYWSSRFVYRTLVFQDDLLVEGRGIR